MFLIDNSHDLGTTQSELIIDKITQPRRLPRLSRARLVNMLEQSMAAGTSTIISGRAGAGKTALAADFANQCGRAVAWYKVDAPDADPRVFFRYLIHSIQTQRPGFGSDSLMALVDSPELELDDLIAWLTEGFVYELAEGDAPSPLLIVIEDLHLVFDSDWLMLFFGRLLPLLPSEVHVLITSRSLPPAPLWRMRSKQSLVVLDEAALAFTRSEAVALFESYGLTSEHAGICLDHTHGRASALDDSAAFLQRSGARAVVTTEQLNARCVF
ncbi:MAG TPA: AAA family ATPase [Pyrinomonadaceae bacterium]|nr:AAA family ATPase [Pyrinomonadaceae bacterium]